MENQDQPNQATAPITPSPQKKQSAAGKMLLTALITALFIGGATFAIMFIFQETQKSSLESSITEKELELQAAQNSLESAETELRETREELEEERIKTEEDKKEMIESSSNLVTNSTRGAGLESLTTNGGITYSFEDLINLIYGNPNRFEARENFSKEDVVVSSFTQDGINNNVLYVEMNTKPGFETPFTEVFRVDFSEDEAPSYIRIFKQDLKTELVSENLPISTNIVGRDKEKLVIINTTEEFALGACFNEWVDAKTKPEAFRNYSYVNLGLISNNLDSTDLNSIISFQEYSPSDEVFDEQSNISKTCAIEAEDTIESLE